jgi:hypothetical protein
MERVSFGQGGLVRLSPPLLHAVSANEAASATLVFDTSRRARVPMLLTIPHPSEESQRPAARILLAK